MIFGINERSRGKTSEIIEKVQNKILDIITHGGSFCVSIKEVDDRKIPAILFHQKPEDPRITMLDALSTWAREQNEIGIPRSALAGWIRDRRTEITTGETYSHVAALKDIVDMIEGRYEGLRMFKETPRTLRTGTSREADLMFAEVRIIKECMDISLDEHGLLKKEGINEQSD